MLIAKSMKSHNIGQSLIKQVYSVQQNSFWGKNSANKLSQISLSNVYARFVSGNSVKEEMLFSHPMENCTTGAAVQENQLSWNSPVGVCPDGAPAMLGLQSGLITWVKKNHLLWVHASS